MTCGSKTNASNALSSKLLLAAILALASAVMSSNASPMVTWSIPIRFGAQPYDPNFYATYKGVQFTMNLPPTLDHGRLEILASSSGWLAGMASRKMKLDRHFVADRTVWANFVIVSTPSLAFSPGFVET